MGFFSFLRPLSSLAKDMKRIANVLEYFAVTDARVNNRMFITETGFRGKDESEVIETTDFDLRRLQDARMESFLAGGLQSLPEEDTF